MSAPYDEKALAVGRLVLALIDSARSHTPTVARTEALLDDMRKLHYHCMQATTLLAGTVGKDTNLPEVFKTTARQCTTEALEFSHMLRMAWPIDLTKEAGPSIVSEPDIHLCKSCGHGLWAHCRPGPFNGPHACTHRVLKLVMGQTSTSYGPCPCKGFEAST
jgi:hypothetical protein